MKWQLNFYKFCSVIIFLYQCCLFYFRFRHYSKAYRTSFRQCQIRSLQEISFLCQQFYYVLMPLRVKLSFLVFSPVIYTVFLPSNNVYMYRDQYFAVPENRNSHVFVVCWLLMHPGWHLVILASVHLARVKIRIHIAIRREHLALYPNNIGDLVLPKYTKFWLC